MSLNQVTQVEWRSFSQSFRRTNEHFVIQQPSTRSHSAANGSETVQPVQCYTTVSRMPVGLPYCSQALALEGSCTLALGHAASPEEGHPAVLCSSLACCIQAHSPHVYAPGFPLMQ